MTDELRRRMRGVSTARQQDGRHEPRLEPRHRAALGAVDHRPARGDGGELRLEHADRGAARPQPDGERQGRGARRRRRRARGARAVRARPGDRLAARPPGLRDRAGRGRGADRDRGRGRQDRPQRRAARAARRAARGAGPAHPSRRRRWPSGSATTATTTTSPRPQGAEDPDYLAAGLDRGRRRSRVRDRRRAPGRARHDAGAVRAACAPSSPSIPAARAST